MYEINLQPVEPGVHAERLSALLAQWLDDCAGRLPGATVEGYRHKIAYVLAWWSAEGARCNWVLTRATLRSLDAWLMQSATTKHEAPPSYNTRKDVLRRFKQALRWSYDTSRLPVDISSWVPAPGGSAPLRTIADAHALAALFDAAYAGPYPLRDATVLAVLIGTGIRRAECAGLDAKDVTIHADLSGTIAVRNAKRVRGRDVHARLVAFEPQTGAYLRRWLDGLPSLDGALFPVGKHERIAAQTVYRIVKRCAEAAGVAVQGPHDLRRIFATTFARHAPGSHLVGLQMGHTSFSQTVRNGYVLQDAQDVLSVLVSPMRYVRHDDIA